MEEEIEHSESGSPIRRYGPPPKSIELAFGDEENIGRISDHIEQTVGAVENVFQEIISDIVHVDLHLVPPGPGREHITIVTSGMSDLPMNAPEDMEDCKHAELAICLPPDWPLEQEVLEDNNHYWPLRWLKILARFPHEYDTWLWCDHTIPNGDPPEPFADSTKLCCMMLAPPLLPGPDFSELKVDAEKTIHFFSLLPLYREEMDFKLKEGADPLFDRFEAAGVNDLIDPNRPNVCRKKWFGLF